MLLLIMTEELASTCTVCKKSSDIFKVLTEEELNRIDCHKASLQYKPGEIIFKQGAPANFFVCVTSGLVKLYIEHQNSRNLILGLARPINYIFEPGPFVDQKHTLTAVACEDTTTCLIDVAIMKDLLRNNSCFADEFIRKISAQALNLFNRISSGTQKHVYGKVADTLLYLHPGIYNENPFNLSLSRQDLADLSGITKESLIRVLKKFKEDNILNVNGNLVEILDPEKLDFISRKG
jgi:CRP/FNR family transcriptional regulator, polysaccharide utilization system transcription regulator